MIIDPAILARSNPKPVTGKAVAEFLRYVLSRQGASAVRDEGNYIPLTPSMAQQGVHSLPLASADF
jgi:ABC-type phosphate transport system substrate-binding protein